MILTQAQAEAVYSAMCALNNVGGMISALIRTDTGKFIAISETEQGVSLRAEEVDLPRREEYDDQAAFATAYGLQ